MADDRCRRMARAVAWSRRRCCCWPAATMPRTAARRPRPAPPPPEVTVAKPLVQKLTEWDEFTGRFEPVQQVEIRARVSGYLQEIGFQDGADRRGGPDAVRDRSAPVSRRPSTAPRRRSRPSSAQLDAGAARAGPRQQAGQHLGRRPRPPSTSAMPSWPRPSASLAGSAGRSCARPSSISASPGSPHPFAGRVSDRRVDIGNLVDATQTAADHHRPARPDLLQLRHVERRTSSPISAPPPRRAALDPRQPDDRPRPSGRRGRLAARGHDELRRQRGRPGQRHDPRPRRSSPTRRPDHARPVRPHPHPRLAASTTRS